MSRAAKEGTRRERGERARGEREEGESAHPSEVLRSDAGEVKRARRRGEQSREREREEARHDRREPHERARGGRVARDLIIVSIEGAAETRINLCQFVLTARAFAVEPFSHK